MFVDRSVLCNCGIEAEYNFLLESLAACQNTNSKLTMYFTVNTAFINYLDKFPNLIVSCVPDNQKYNNFDQTLPISQIFLNLIQLY